MNKKKYRKYRLHQKIKELYRCNSSLKTVFVPYDFDFKNKYVLELQRNYNYQIQLEIPVQKMITSDQKQKIIEVLGKQFSRSIITHLTKNKIFNAYNCEFSPSSIQKIVSGVQPCETVEMEIAKLVAKVKIQKKKNEEAKAKFLN